MRPYLHGFNLVRSLGLDAKSIESGLKLARLGDDGNLNYGFDVPLGLQVLQKDFF